MNCEATFSAVITALSQHLITTRPNRLRVLYVCSWFASCSGGVLLTRILRVISFEAIADKEIGFLSARQKVIATIRGRLYSLLVAPKNVIALLIAQSLNIPRPSLDSAKDPSIHDKRRRLLQPPSRSESSHVTTGP